MSDHHEDVRSGNFYPFGRLWHSAWKFDVLAERLGLSHLQRELLSELLKDIEIKIWFFDKEHGAPGLEVVVFWEIDQGDTHVASANLLDVLEDTFGNTDQLETAEEIAALTKLRDEIDKAIAKRQSKEP